MPRFGVGLDRLAVRLAPPVWGVGCKLIDPGRPRYVVSTPIFVSYSTKDQKIAETFCRALEARGRDC
jgi:hypothetical protein